MDVTCPQCGTHYQLDPAQIPEGGLPVKCSACQNVFRAERPVLTTGQRPWVVRQMSGNTFQFKELTTLQRWIVERKVSRTDQISNDGQTWKRLGDIAELAPFFQAIDNQAGAPPQGFPAAPSAPPGPRPTGQWEMGELHAGDEPAFATNRRPTYPGTMPPDGYGADVDLDEMFPARRGGGGKAKWVVLILLLGLGGAGGYIYTQRPELIEQFLGKKIPPLAMSHVNTGDADLLKGTREAIDSAVDNYEKAISLAGEYPSAHAGLTEGLLARAEYALDEVDVTKRKIAAIEVAKKARQEEIAAENEKRRTARRLPRKEPEPPPEEGAELETLTKKVTELEALAKKHTERAFASGTEGLRLDPEGVRAKRAMAAYYAMSGPASQMHDLLKAVDAVTPGDPWVDYIRGAVAAKDESSLSRATRYLDAALESQPEMNRARYRMAVVLLNQEKHDEALAQVKDLLERVPSHELGKELLLILEPPEPEPEEEEPEEESEQVMGFDRLMAQATRLRMADRPEPALRLFEQALDREPDDPDALAGIGWCYVDLDQADAAIASFRRVLRQAPKFSDAHMGLAEAYRAKGMKRDAVKHYQRYLEILPNGPEAAVARRALKQLQ